MKIKVSQALQKWAEQEFEGYIKYPKAPRPTGKLTASEEKTLKHIFEVIEKRSNDGRNSIPQGIVGMQLFDGGESDKRMGTATNYSGHIKNVLSMEKKGYVRITNKNHDKIKSANVEPKRPAAAWLLEKEIPPMTESKALSFKKYLLAEGGNVIINDIAAERIDLSKISREAVITQFYEMFKTINTLFAKQYGLPIWSPELFKNKKFLSGSAFHFFNTTIDTAEFVSFKQRVGDIDVQVDREQEKNVIEFLNSIEGQTIKGIKMVGSKKSVDQQITVWQLQDPAVNVQVDFEFVDFSNGQPTPWSVFSHSSSWDDIKAGVKGAFHKFLLRALTTKTLKEMILLKGKRRTPKKLMSTELAFSVVRGLRTKLAPELDDQGNQIFQDGLPVFAEVPTKDSKFITDLDVMFRVMFGKEPTTKELDQFGSYVGILELVDKYFTPNEKAKVVHGFVLTLWGERAQFLYRGDKPADIREKTVAYEKMIQILGSNYDKKEVSKMKVDYYKNKV